MKKLLLFTDLDGTLLDHQNYDWQPARPAIERLQQLGYPLIFNTSKTLAELIPFSVALGSSQPMICENGNLAATPQNYFPALSNPHSEYYIELFGRDYQSILGILALLRDKQGFDFSGFYDLGIEGVVAATGLDQQSASRACQRLSSEPLLWHDTEARLEQFIGELKKRGLSMTRGGRFYHVMSPTNKAVAMAWMLKQYQALEPATEWTTVALGDSDNDIQMLQAADHAVLISNPHSRAPDCSHIEKLITPQQPGPTGWNDAVNHIIDLHLKE